MRIREEQYFIDLEGRLRYADALGEIVLEGEPYVVLELDSREKPELEQWAATSVTATSSQRFLKLDEDGNGNAQDVVDVLKSFNDVVMVNHASKLSKSLERQDLPPNERQDLEAKRDAMLKKIQDESIREILKPKK